MSSIPASSEDDVHAPNSDSFGMNLHLLTIKIYLVIIVINVKTLYFVLYKNIVL